MTPEQHIWACALAVEKQHGKGAPLFVAERIGALALADDGEGVAMWKAIAVRLDPLRHGAQSAQDVPRPAGYSEC